MDPLEIAGELYDRAREVTQMAVDEAKRFAASEQGRKIRHNVATGLIVAAPAVVSLPVLRRTRIGKWIELAGGAALVVTVAEKIRDWNPGEAAG
ncbi:MAG TPA: hypothetical protein VGW79_05670 [Actinomycetota bacterium]|nr:hypothetical protein [Actinomycetota bacterium]